MIRITAAHLRAIAPAGKPEIINAMVEHQHLMANAGLLNTRMRAAHFLAQCAHETGGFTILEESLYYTSAARIVQVWPSRFNLTTAAEYVRQPRKLANAVYGGRMGNNTDKVPAKFRGDAGWQYRGSGAQQATGYDNFAEVERAIGEPVTEHPELLRSFPAALKSAVVYWVNRPALIAAADANNVERVTYLINGGQIGLADRKVYLARALRVDFDDLEVPDREPSAVEYISVGAEGPKVLRIQERLRAHGYYLEGKLDGDFGGGTRAEVIAFQREKGLLADGVVGPKTMDALNAEPERVAVPVEPAPPVIVAPQPSPAPQPIPAPQPTTPTVEVPSRPPVTPTPPPAADGINIAGGVIVVTLVVIAVFLRKHIVAAAKWVGRKLSALRKKVW